MKNQLGVLSIFLALSSSAAFARYCPMDFNGKAVEEISAEDLIPTQYGMGKRVVDEIYAKYAKKGFLDGIRERFAEKPLPVIKTTDYIGEVKYYLKDNHHMVIPVQMALKNGVLTHEIRLDGDTDSLVCVAIQDEIVNVSWDAFMSNLLDGTFGSKLGYFSKGTRAALENGNITLSDAYFDLFSKRLDELDDVLLRSNVADVFQKFDIKGRSFSEYIEFFLAEKAEELSPDIMVEINALSNGTAFNADLSTFLTFKALFGHNDIVTFWEDQIRGVTPEEAVKISQKLRDCQSFYLANLTVPAFNSAGAEQQLQAWKAFAEPFAKAKKEKKK